MVQYNHMNQVQNQVKSRKSLVPVLSVAMTLSLALSYFTFFSSSSFQVERAGNTAAVVLAQAGTNPNTTPNSGNNSGGITDIWTNFNSAAQNAARGVTNAAQNANGGTNPNQQRNGFANPLGQQGGTLQTFLYALLDKVIIPLGAIVVVFSIILAGFKYITAQGDPKAIAAAHQQLTWTAIGAAVLLGAKVISMVITNTVKTLTS